MVDFAIVLLLIIAAQLGLIALLLAILLGIELYHMLQMRKASNNPFSNFKFVELPGGGSFPPPDSTPNKDIENKEQSGQYM